MCTSSVVLPDSAHASAVSGTTRYSPDPVGLTIERPPSASAAETEGESTAARLRGRGTAPTSTGSVRSLSTSSSRSRRLRSIRRRLHRGRRLLRLVGLSRDSFAVARHRGHRVNRLSALLLQTDSPSASRARRRARRHRGDLPEHRDAGRSPHCRGRHQGRGLVRRELVLHPPIERLLRGRRPEQSGPPLLVALDRGAVLSRLAAPSGRDVRGRSSLRQSSVARGADHRRRRARPVAGQRVAARQRQRQPRRTSAPTHGRISSWPAPCWR